MFRLYCEPELLQTLTLVEKGLTGDDGIYAV
jgi:hypothetical protein